MGALSKIPVIGPFLDPVGAIIGAIAGELDKNRDAMTERQRIESDEHVATMRFKKDVMVAAMAEPWWTPRSLMGYGATFVVLKLLVWDTALQDITHSVTDDPGTLVIWLIMTIVGGYFISKSADAVAMALGNVIARRYTGK